jgi:biopolymer transport protein ExbD
MGAGSLPYKDIIDVLNAAKGAGIEKVGDEFSILNS